jgi:class 3 adenylate cyclase
MSPRRRFAISVLVILSDFLACLQLAAAQTAATTAFPVDASRSQILSGPWEFYPGALLEPDDARWTDKKQLMHLRLPATWNDLSWEGKAKGAPEGMGTYRIHLILGKAVKIWAINWYLAGSAARVWWQGHLIHEAGRVGSSTTTEIPGNVPEVLALTDTGDGWLVIQVSNFHHVDGGLWAPISLASMSTHQAKRAFDSGSDLFLAGGFMLFGLLGALATIILKRERASLWFGLLALTIGASLFFNGAMTVYQFIPELSWEWFNKVRHLTMYLAPLWFMLFIHSLIPASLATWFRKGFTALAAIGIGLVLLLPYRWYGNLFYPWAVILAVAVIYTLGALFRVSRSQDRLAGFSLAGILLFLAGTAYEFIRTAFFLPLPNLFALTTFGLLAFMALTLGLHISTTYRKLDRLNREIHGINQSLHRFFPQEFLALLEKSSLSEVELGHSRRMELAVLFADIRGFSRLSQGMAPEEIFALINDFLGAVGPAIRRHGGFVDKYLGDGIMALFPDGGAPALDAAVDMHRALDDLNLRNREVGRLSLGIGVGIHAGPLLLGTIGERARMDTTVISSVVNLASRLEALTRDYDARIIISPQVLMALPPDCPHEYRFLGFENLKGFDHPLPAYEVFSADEPAIRDQKRQSKAPLEDALILFGRHEYPEAARALKQLHQLYPGDPAPRTYLDRIRAIREKRIIYQVTSQRRRLAAAHQPIPHPPHPSHHPE